MSGNGGQIKRIIIITIIEFVTGKSRAFGRNEKLKSRARYLKIRKNSTITFTPNAFALSGDNQKGI